MKYLPIGLNVQGRRCVVVGGGKIGTRKVENLLRAGAAVSLVSPEASRRIRDLADSGRISWAREPFREEHLRGAFLAVAATDDEALNARLATAAREYGVLSCDASSAERSEVIFGALHHEGGITLAVFSDGEDPARSQAVRDRIAALVSLGPERQHRGAGSPMLILMAHGSRDPQWRKSLAELAAAVQSGSPGEEVRLAFMQFSGPMLPTVVEEAWERGISEFRILPLFMASAGHVDKDIRPLVAELAERFPAVRFDILTPIGEDPLFQELIPRLVDPQRS